MSVSAQQELITAIRIGDLKRLKQALHDGAKTDVSDTWTPLVLACSRNEEDCVAALLDHGANPDFPCSDGDLALNRAVINKHAGIVLRLMEKKANPLLIGLNKMSALDCAKDDPLMSELLKPGSVPVSKLQSVFLAAYQNKNVGVARRLLERGVDPDQLYAGGMTALHSAVKEGNLALIALLAQYNARKDIPDGNGETILDFLRKTAEKEWPAEILEALKINPKDVNWRLVSSTEVAHTRWLRAVDRQLTEVFNFETRERLILTRNLKTGAEGVSAPQNFKDIANRRLIEEAMERMEHLGGKVDRDAVWLEVDKRNKKDLPGTRAI